jgi:hypothetical protein
MFMNWRERRDLYDNGDAAAAAAAANDDDVENGVDEASSDFEAGEFLLLPVMSLLPLTLAFSAAIAPDLNARTHATDLFQILKR